jgi:hypothetical protein
MCGEQRETICMSIAIPVSLLNDKAYSEWASRLAMEGKTLSNSLNG